MSYVEWTCGSGQSVKMSGAERSWWGQLVRDVSASMIPDWCDAITPRLNPASHLVVDFPDGLPRRDYRLTGMDLRRALVMDLAHGSGPPPLANHDGTPLHSFGLCLNTVLAIGNPVLQLLARLDGQCEIHAYVLGPDRPWMADLIRQGLGSGLMREHVGWDGVLELLDARQDQPVVTSYSVCDGFPAVPASWPLAPAYDDLAADDPEQDMEQDWKRWEALTAEEKFAVSFAEIGKDRHLSPATLAAPFEHRVSLLDLFIPQVARPWKPRP